MHPERQNPSPSSVRVPIAQRQTAPTRRDPPGFPPERYVLGGVAVLLALWGIPSIISGNLNVLWFLVPGALWGVFYLVYTCRPHEDVEDRAHDTAVGPEAAGTPARD